MHTYFFNERMTAKEMRLCIAAAVGDAGTRFLRGMTYGKQLKSFA